MKKQIKNKMNNLKKKKKRIIKRNRELKMNMRMKERI
jgi:hypothetical protein